MRRLKLIVGRVAFWGGWPLWWLIMHGTDRSRVLLVADGTVLLIRDALGAGEWGLPGGGIHRGEAVAVGACREIYEEVGIGIASDQLRELAVEPTHNSGISYIAHYMVAELATHEVTKPTIEVAEVRWVQVKKVPELHVDDATKRALELWAAG